MADIELVIKIDEEEYRKISNSNPSYADDFNLYYAIKNGTPLPKGHGKIGDLDAVMSDISTSIEEMSNIGIAVDGEYLWAKLNDAIYNAPTIIEADKGYEVEVITRGNCMMCGKELVDGLFFCKECENKANSRK